MNSHFYNAFLAKTPTNTSIATCAADDVTGVAAADEGEAE
jgi:hypothetical protein